jgi:hypothetical protein
MVVSKHEDCVKKRKSQSRSCFPDRTRSVHGLFYRPSLLVEERTPLCRLQTRLQTVPTWTTSVPGGLGADSSCKSSGKL